VQYAVLPSLTPNGKHSSSCLAFAWSLCSPSPGSSVASSRSKGNQQHFFENPKYNGHRSDACAGCHYYPLIAAASANGTLAFKDGWCIGYERGKRGNFGYLMVGNNGLYIRTKKSAANGSIPCISSLIFCVLSLFLHASTQAIAAPSSYRHVAQSVKHIRQGYITGALQSVYHAIILCWAAKADVSCHVFSPLFVRTLVRGRLRSARKAFLRWRRNRIRVMLHHQMRRLLHSRFSNSLLNPNTPVPTKKRASLQVPSEQYNSTDRNTTRRGRRQHSPLFIDNHDQYNTASHSKPTRLSPHQE